MHGLVRCKHERRCSCAYGADVSFRDVTIKIPDRGYDQGCEWHHTPEAWAEIFRKSVSWILVSEEAGWLSEFAVALQPVRTWFGADGKVSIERLCLSPYVEKPFSSKVIKSFIPELRSCKCFLCFGIPMLTIYVCYGHYEHFVYRYEYVWEIEIYSVKKWSKKTKNRSYVR